MGKFVKKSGFSHSFLLFSFSFCIFYLSLQMKNYLTTAIKTAVLHGN